MLKNFPHAEFVTAFYGADVSQSCATELLEDAQKLLPDAEIVMFPAVSLSTISSSPWSDSFTIKWGCKSSK